MVIFGEFTQRKFVGRSESGLKIGIYNDWWYPDLVGGTERSALEISEGLISKYGIESIFIGTLSNRLRTRVDSDNGVEVIRVGSFTLRKRYLVSPLIRYLERFRIFIDLVSSARVAREFSLRKIDVLIIHNMDRLGVKFPFMLKYLYGVNVIRIVHDLSDTCTNRKRFRNNRNCSKTCMFCRPKLRLAKDVSRKMYEGMICNSKFTLKKIKSLGIYNDFMDYGYVLVPSQMQQSPNFISNRNINNISVGFVGRISPEKGIELLIVALGALRKKYSGFVRLTLAGQGNPKYLTKLSEIGLEESIDVQFLGYSENPYEALRAHIDVIVIPSLWEETLGRVAFEAATNNFPVIVSNAGGLQEAAALSNRRYFIFNAGDQNSLEDTLEKFYSNLDPGIQGSSKEQFIVEVLIERLSYIESLN
jgi:glycosyltransferase involved in cell wall biosynthesis